MSLFEKNTNLATVFWQFNFRALAANITKNSGRNNREFMDCFGARCRTWYTLALVLLPKRQIATRT
ncbi:MAG: hypothetical protein HC908_17950 [Calothrix sp. SM1_7_51]|nr:hypothetical protein [Calothrix sp. SM1_7_51]